MTQDGSTAPVRLGIIGSGLAVKYLHAPAIKNLPGKYDIVVSCARSEESAREGVRLAAEELNSPGCSWTTDYHEVLNNPAVEAVLLSLPIQLNATIMRDAARAGKHIIAEKPLAGDLAEARQLLDELRPYAGLVIEIAENFHYREDFARAREWMAAGRIGQVFMIEMQSRFWVDTSRSFASTPWRYEKQFRGGLVADGGVHYAAALRELGGEVAQVQAYTTNAHPQMTDADTLLLNLRYRNGVVANLLYTGAAQTRETTAMHGLIYGREGVIELANGKVTLTTGGYPQNEVVEEYEVADFDMGYTGEFLNFYQAIRQGQPVVCTPEEAYRDFALIMHALDSADNGGVAISLPDQS